MGINDQEIDKWTHVVKNILIDHLYLFFNYVSVMHKLLPYNVVSYYNFIFKFHISNKITFVI